MGVLGVCLLLQEGKGRVVTVNDRQEAPVWCQLRVCRDFPSELSLSLFGGLAQGEKTLSQIKEETSVVRRAGFKRILLPWNAVACKEWEGLKALISDSPYFWCLQAHSNSLRLFQKKTEGLLPSSNLILDLLVEDFSKNLESFIKNLKTPFQITIPAHRGIDLQKLKDKIPLYLHSKIHVHFPCFHKPHPRLHTNREIYGFLSEKWFPPPPHDVFNLSIPEDLELEAEIAPEFYYKTPVSNPALSVIIPSYNGKKELPAVLQNLFRQNLSKQNFEVIVIDDGGFDGTGKILKEQAFLKKMNFKYIYFPRKKKRRRGDHRFRAGPARNLGVKQAEGAGLVFLDSDILVGEGYLKSALKALERHNVIQHPRFHLKRKAPTEYSKINPVAHTFVRGNGYWEKFYADGKNWNNKRLPWKYVSTNSLCLKKELFKKAGRFRRNYTCYGFEDTDLGWRLYQMGRKFHLNDFPVYHLFHQSEFLHFNFLKRNLLSRSVNIFFHNTHSLKGYREFAHLLLRPPGFRGVFRKGIM